MSLKIYICICIFFGTVFEPISCEDEHYHFRKHVALFIFGDSLYDAGNNNYLNTTDAFRANYKPYGQSFFKLPSGRFSDGRLVPDFIANYAKLQLIPPYLQPQNRQRQYINGVNFASAGAGALAETFQGFGINLKTQLNHFKIVKISLQGRLGNEEAKRLVSKAVYMFNIGTNDYRHFLHSPKNSLYSDLSFVDMVIGNLTPVIKEIYKRGGRKFAFEKLRPLGCIPNIRIMKAGRKGDCLKAANKVAELHNMALTRLLMNLRIELKAFKYSITDSYSFTYQRLNNPKRYGFKNGKTACCGSGPYNGVISCGGKRQVKGYQLCRDPSDYLYFDSVHPTERANKQLAELMWNGPTSLVKPYNLKVLFED